MDDFMDVLLVALYNLAVVHWLSEELQLMGLQQDRRERNTS